MSYFSGVIGLESVSREVADVNACKRMNLASNAVLGETPSFVDLGLLPANTADKLNSVFTPATKVEEFTDSSNWIASRHGITEVAEVRVIEAKSYSEYIKYSEFETMNVFERENISLTRPTSLTRPISLTRPVVLTRTIALNGPIYMTLPTLENISLT